MRPELRSGWSSSTNPRIGASSQLAGTTRTRLAQTQRRVVHVRAIMAPKRKGSDECESERAADAKRTKEQLIMEATTNDFEADKFYHIDGL